MESRVPLQDAKSLYLHLEHPSPEECLKIWTDTSSSWKDSLTVSAYLAESQFLTTIPLARDQGMTTWVLVDKSLPPNKRPILCSCETFRKRSLTADAEGNIEEVVVHGVASVFCPPEYRGRGYASRHMEELARQLRQWQTEHGKSAGSVLYSDIGPAFYTRFGWLPNVRNMHLVLPAAERKELTPARLVLESDLEDLCRKDEALIRAAMATPHRVKKRVTIIPDLDHMLWHIRKEDFATKQIFGRIPRAKGAIAGSPGKLVWAIWVHRYYEHPDEPGEEGSNNVLFILRLVVEGDETANMPLTEQAPLAVNYDKQAVALKAVLQAAQAEASEWRLDHVHMWEPSPLIDNLVTQSGLDVTRVERQEESIASMAWFQDDDETGSEPPVWINNEYYAWC
ncbi:hypothetical protein GQ53DRAFT_740384 [Thozetella sp. PMI_491]|nr:hypothetical protein GQ53DRAFT_740384 [Thozetella sp. PMI_491]